MEIWHDTDGKGRRVRPLLWNGSVVRVRDGADIAFRVISLWAERGLDAASKLDIAARLLFCDPEGAAALGDFEGLLAEAVRQVAGFDPTKGAEPVQDPVIDLEQDAQIIYSSLFRAYGMPLEAIAREVTLDGLIALMAGVPHETPLGQALYYRTAEPPEDRERARAFRERREHWRLKGAAPKAPNMDDLFDSF